SILKERIEQYDVATDLAEVGTVLQVGDGIARIHGLENCVALEMLELEHGVVGLAFNLEEDNVGAALFGDWERVREGEPVRRAGRAEQVDGAVRGRRDRRALPLQGPARTRDLRRPDEARGRVPAAFAAPPSPAGPRGVPGRRLLPALPAAGARVQASRGGR